MTRGSKTKKGRGIVWILNWTVDDVSFWANWWLAGSLAIGVLATVAIIVSGNIKEAALREDVAKSNERAAKLEKEAADARLELARIDPINQPIKSLRADVFFLTLHGVFTNGAISQNPAPAQAACFLIKRKGELDPKSDPLALLSCVSLEPASTYGIQQTSRGPTKTPMAANGFSMVFNWPSNEYSDALRAQNNIAFWIEKTNASTSALDKEDVAGQLFLFGLPRGLEIVSSNCVLTINGSIQRRFSFPVRTDTNGVVLVPK